MLIQRKGANRYRIDLTANEYRWLEGALDDYESPGKSRRVSDFLSSARFQLDNDQKLSHVSTVNPIGP